VANEENVSLVVMGARGWNLIQSAVLGSVSRNVLRFGDKHLLIMRYKTIGGAKSLEFPGAKGTRGLRDEGNSSQTMEKFCTDLFSKVLIPTDFSQPVEAAISFVKNVNRIGEVFLLHVAHKGETQEEIDKGAKIATEKLQGMAGEL
jgi:hypothetical protein